MTLVILFDSPTKPTFCGVGECIWIRCASGGVGNKTIGADERCGNTEIVFNRTGDIPDVAGVLVG